MANPDPSIVPETVSRSLPWSTRAVILVAFAIQFGSVGAGVAASVTASPMCPRVCDGGLLPMLWADSAYRGAAEALAGPSETACAVGDGCGASTPPAGTGFAPVRLVCPAQLPIPPPAVG